ncbi:LytTR family DNA-binding domain-containing protein [Aureisphaera galaxeae]|uniref:LytTR family DNA-binding domain-containing protein n=1 Tax=Aureisphaera galaxeae TaxID=1538023 RepID=UPI002350534A|nr:LytTR family DNA-binding domain-containing protein [Aureisphaera galaxeae]MDC8004687.1 LytTR family DNA-binding domain-containing protein [Aureisphaera galaxeae]
MPFFDYFKTPFPRPERNKKSIFWVVLVGISASIFILLYKPFGIQNETGEWFINLIIFGIGLLFIVSVLFAEWFLPWVFPKPFRKWTLGKALIWYSLLILFLGMNNFLYKNYWAGFKEFTWSEFLMVLARTLGIGITVTFFVLGIWRYVNRRKFSLISLNENYLVTSQDGKSVRFNPKDILYISSDDNYVDIHYEEKGARKKMVLRSSLKNVESQIVNPLSPILRCHRSYLINAEYFSIKKMTSRSMTIGLTGYEDEVPVSKQYAEQIQQRLQIRP